MFLDIVAQGIGFNTIAEKYAQSLKQLASILILEVEI
jgi:hypothetical protein